jgi:tRNA dimethylallyltransferase
MIIAIVGPTSVGKSEVALLLAKKIGAEIINADAYQVYQGMDIGTAKLPLRKRQSIKHHLIDYVPYTDSYDVARYQKEAREIIDEKAADTPLIFVGGSGFYLKSVLHELKFPDKKSYGSGEALSNTQLYIALQDLDPKALEKIHINNRKRLLNAYHRAVSGEPMSKESSHEIKRYDYRMFGLNLPRPDLIEKINLRVETMIEEGLEKEAYRILNHAPSPTAQEAIGYKEWRPYFEGTASLNQVIEAIKKNTRRYAKKQMSYFNHQFEVEWFNPMQQPIEKIVEAMELSLQIKRIKT